MTSEALARLRAGFTAGERGELPLLLSRAENDRDRLALAGSLRFDRLKAVRISPSDTLFAGKGVDSWVRASDEVAKRVRENALPDWPALSRLHAALIGGEGGSALRAEPVQGGNCAYPPGEDLEALRDDFARSVLAPLGNEHAVLEAAKLYQWLVTCHFFPDANGRLARLAADWRLALGGFPPLGFPNGAASFVSALDEARSYGPFTAVRRVTEGIRNSVDALCG